MALFRKSKESTSSVSRRDFLRVGGLSVVGLSVAEQAAMASGAHRRNCIFLLMTGGPSQYETFDPKPEAPIEIRGSVRSIETAIPGVRFSEGLPKLAERANKLTVLRTLNHDAAPIHETGMQLLQTGRLASKKVSPPSFGSVVAKELGGRGGVLAQVLLPARLSNTGVNMRRGQDAGFLDESHETLVDNSLDDAEFAYNSEADAVRRSYGETRFGRLCCRARQLVEAGVRCVTVNLFDSLPEQVTWDCHARSPISPATVFDYRDQLCPQFDQAVAALMDDLEQRGLLNDTLIVATGEFGRTACLNENNGRDHWTSAWSGIVAGGGINGGQVIGATDSKGSSPVDRPINVSELHSTICERLGLDGSTELAINDEQTIPVATAEPIAELVG
ncbi:MAG: hypothetical protein CMJ78_12460 [Planctomycetaceae bacterium]|nr:hypothetical protein [Planctomycetaceae bacterium]